jgi:predicted nuclease of restriction endonuclease-like (RecB) superfamily
MVKTENTQDPQLASLVGNLGELIRQARQKVLRAVDTAQVQTCWQIGRHIVEFEQEGARRAGYGKQLLSTLAKALTAEFGKGFDETNLRKMRLFYQAFPIRDALRLELSWTHYRRLLRVDSDKARKWYMDESANQNWSSRALERQISTLYYERLLMSRDKSAVMTEAITNIHAMNDNPREFVRDPVMLEFLGLSDTGVILETELEQALIKQLQGFLLELGKKFCIYRSTTTNKHRRQRLLYRSGVLQLLAQLLRHLRPEARRINPSGCWTDGHVCTHVRRS